MAIKTVEGGMAIQGDRLETYHQIPPLIQPFQVDGRGMVPLLVTNGKKGKFAAESGLGVVSDQRLLALTARAEDAYHNNHKETAIGPFWVHIDGMKKPYPLVVARAKLQAVQEMMPGKTVFCTDSVYRAQNKRLRIDETFHKPDGEEDLQRVLRRFYEHSEAGDSEFMSTTGIARSDGKNFFVVTRLGRLKLVDPGQLEQRLRNNGTASLGTPTLQVNGVMVELNPIIHTTVFREPDEGGIWQEIGGVFRPVGRADIMFPSDLPLMLHRAGLGFVGMKWEW